MIGAFYRHVLRPRLFQVDAEDAHDRVMGRLSRLRTGWGLVEALLGTDDERLAVRLGPLTFRNPIGLAAGLDKTGEAAHVWTSLGFGFHEIGTITPRPQPGNPRPRLFRLPADGALINRFGFNGPGVEAVARTLGRAAAREARRPDAPRGLNVGKNKDTPPERAGEDHRICIECLRPFADYFVVNLSSPNTPGLRALQQPAWVRGLVSDAVDAARGTPVFVKIAPDWDAESDLDETVSAIVAGGAFGIVATNTTVSRAGLVSPPTLTAETGGLSGAPLTERSRSVLRRVRQIAGPNVAIVAVGGIATADEVFTRLTDGADLVQLYTGFIYAGPTLPRALCRGLGERLDAGQRFKSMGRLPSD